MSRFAYTYEDPDYFYDLDEEGQWVEIQCDADGTPIEPSETVEDEQQHSPYYGA